MKATVLIEKDHATASAAAADIIASALVENPELTATFAAGDTPFACYAQLIARQQRGELQLGRTRYIGLDEWVGLGPKDTGSCIETMQRGYYGPAGVPDANIAYYDGRAADPQQEALRMAELLANTGGLDLAVLGVGVNGHIGFNEPGPEAAGDFAVVPLSDTTQTVGKKYFGGRATPTQGATLTLQALRGAARVVVLATGAAKQPVVSALLAGNRTLPLAAFCEHPGAYYILDSQSAGQA